MIKNKYYLALFLLIAFHLVNNYIWIKKDAESLGWDVCHHVDITVSVHHELKEVILAKMPLYQKASQIARIFTSGRLEWPRFVHFFAAAISLPAQDMLFSFRFTNIFYLLIMIISVYLIGTLISGPQAGVLSAALVSFYPGLFQNSRKFGLDFPLAAVVCLSIYLLLASNQFRERRYSLLFGIVTGIGALIKGQILVYVSAPVLYSFFLIFKERRALPSGTLKNILMSAISFTAIALIWWHRVFSHEMVFALDKHMAWGSFPEPIPSPLLERFQGFITDTYLNISPALFWVFIAGLFVYLRRLDKKKILILCWLSAPYIILSGFLSFYNYRYTYPIFGSIALISVIGLSELPLKKSVRFSMFWLIICFSCFQFFHISYFRIIRRSQAATEWSHPPRNNNHRQIVRMFNEEIEKSSVSLRNVGIIEERYMNGDRCVRLGYFLKVLDRHNLVSLSAGGIYPSMTKDEFLRSAQDLQFLIAFSQSAAGPDLAGLMDFSEGGQRDKAAKAVALFRGFKIVRSALLFPEGLRVFLLKREQ